MWSRIEGNEHAITLTKLEYRILEAVKTSAKTENKISKHIGINTYIVSPIITSLILRGYIQTTTKRRVLIRYSEYFSITVEGLAAFEANLYLFHPFTRAIFQLRDLINARILKHEDGWTFFTLGLGVAKVTYNLLKTVLVK